MGDYPPTNHPPVVVFDIFLRNIAIVSNTSNIPPNGMGFSFSLLGALRMRALLPGV